MRTFVHDGSIAHLPKPCKAARCNPLFFLKMSDAIIISERLRQEFFQNSDTMVDFSANTKTRLAEESLQISGFEFQFPMIL